ncbi:DUF309 domain-containing protein [Paenibacillus harenae]|uniref:DUF309 domain-containing protein n=1 Tax=Paenibacillus harenae TaxID=306543 RepID=UPI000427658B|nr:DUF309 domain-containing protein [Paenibacillus harenae]
MTNFPNSYVSYLVEFHASRDFFECHELLEEYWKEHPEDTRADVWVGLIQLAVALYHERRGNVRGALKMLKQAEPRLSLPLLESLGIDRVNVVKQVSERIEALTGEHRPAYVDLNLRILDKDLMARCQAECEERGLQWESPSPMKDASIIHRHKLRDRSEVIAARQEAWHAKKKERGD